MLIDLLRPLPPMTELAVRQYTYIQLIDMILSRLTITQNGLKNLLS